MNDHTQVTDPIEHQIAPAESQTASTDAQTDPTQQTESLQPDAQTSADETEEKPAKHAEGRRRCVPIGAILVLAGWVLMMFYPKASLVCTVAGLVFSIIGVRIPPGPRRDIATTAIVAGGVLLVVFALFATVLYLI